MNRTMQERRLETLEQIHELLPKCNCWTAKELKTCQNCAELKRLGQLLTECLSPRRDIGVTQGSNKEKKEPTRLEISVEMYVTYKMQQLIDREIAEKKNVNVSTLSRWRRRHKAEIEQLATERGIKIG